jgi:hypothetical protein
MNSVSNSLACETEVKVISQNPMLAMASVLIAFINFKF